MNVSLNMGVRRTILALASVCMLALGLLITPARPASASSYSADYITRAEVIARAKDWYGRGLTYSRSVTTSDVEGNHQYRKDCSGMVSMAWHANSSGGGYNTDGLPSVSTKISRSTLRLGDLLDDTIDGHAILFEAWASDGVHFSYYSFGSTPMRHYDGGSGSTEGPLGSFTSGTYLAGHPEENYVAYTYNLIVDAIPGKLADVNGDGSPELIGLDIHGNLYVYPHNNTPYISSSMWGSRVWVGGGWNTYNWIAFADVNGDGYPDILGRDASGDLYVYRHNFTNAIGTSMWGSRIWVGGGWDMYNTVLVGDVNDDGYPDILGRDSSGNLYGYPHNPTTSLGTSMWGGRTLVGSGWNMYPQIALDSVGKNNSRTTGDGDELIGLDSAGNLYAYPNNDFGTVDTSTFASRIWIGGGWDMYSTFLTGDSNSDGYTDLLGLDAGGGLYAYPNNRISTIGTDWGSRVHVGSGWNMYYMVD